MARKKSFDPTKWHTATESANGCTTTYAGVLQKDTGKLYMPKAHKFQKKGQVTYVPDYAYRIRYTRKNGARVDEVVGKSSEGWSARDAFDKLLEFKANDAEDNGKPVSFADERAIEDRKVAEEQARGSVRQLFQDYVDWMRGADRRTWERVQHALIHAEAAPAKFFGLETKAKDVTTQDIMRYLKSIHDRGSYGQAAHMRAYLSGAFNHGLKREHDYTRSDIEVVFGLSINPVTAIPTDPKAKNVGERYLSEEELRTVWIEIGNGTYSQQTVLATRLLIATCGQRVREVLYAKCSEFDLENKLWTMPIERVKNKRKHVIPISDRAVALIKEAMEINGGSEFLFPHRDNLKEPMKDASLRRAFTRMCEARGYERFNGRDLRRTARTLLSDVEVPCYLQDIFLNHGQNSVGHRHYDRSIHLADKLRVLNKWEELLFSLIEPTPHQSAA